ncbi:hypothetical protein [Micromonospora sp. WMMD712]|uniref:hypothetical protein n=1 Tax=Micromonospora sp. WMMD712 TaxID=3016096 RepID=UPI00249A6B01|nr:hypothetical protein [Micromonospora sp. WMMD712]WFE60051.1 hypothetical protein O7633_25815 [Micromonospora sp. WMMD712]
MTMPGSVEQTKAEIRFALNQLAARNGQHEFETLTRMLARATVTRNVIPATGPVAAGGDQGRDFETFHTELAGQTQRLGREIGMREGDGVGFTCTLQQADIGSKIRSDIDKIMAAGTAVTFILAYCEVNIPVARRHDLQREVRDQHGVCLEIFDGTGITELLAQHSTFWIAEQYLHLPARALPPPPDRPGWYEADLARWHATTEPVVSWGHYVDLAGCLRYAYLTREGREDIPFWLDRLAPLLDERAPRSLRHAARHQTIVAHHLGLGSMHPIDHLTAAEIDAATTSNDANLISDATVVLLLTCAAFARGETSHTADRLMAWNRALTAQVEQLLTGARYAGDVCSLLESLAALRMQPDLERAAADGTVYAAPDATTDLTLSERLQAVTDGELAPIDVPSIDRSGVMGALGRLAESLPDAPLYPVEPVCRFLSLNAALLIDEPQFDALVDVFDRRLAASMGDGATADKALDRAGALFTAGRRLAGLRHLHRARLRLFNGEAGPRLIEATLATAEAYRILRLDSAAKYYGLVAAALTQREHFDLYPQGLFKAAAADYHQGNWISSTQLNRAALLAHGLLAEQAFDLDRHSWLRYSIFELVNTRALADKLGTAYKDLVDDAIAEAGVAGLVDAFVAGVSPNGPPWWESVDADQHVAHVVKQLGRPAFADAGPQRQVRFQCLGVTWTIEFDNQEPDVAVGERFAAALQITLAHLADTDLALIPTEAKIFVATGAPGTDLTVEQVESTPTQTRFRCTLPTVEHRSPDNFTTVAQQTLGAVAAVIVTVSTLSDERWMEVLDQAIEQDLPSIVMFATPHDVALQDATRHNRLQRRIDGTRPLGDDTTCPGAGPGLEFPDTPGPGYTLAHSHDQVRYKYEHLPRLMQPTLEALRHAPTFADTVAALRKRGWLDWHILVAIHGVAKNARLHYRSPHSPDDLKTVRELFLSPEPDGDPVPLEFFSVPDLELALDATTASAAGAMWKLKLRQESIDIDAVKRLLIVRYGWARDDIEHVDPFRPCP